MSNDVLVLTVSISCLAVALTIVSLKLAKHEKHFKNVQDILLMIGMKLHELDHAVDKKKESKKNVSV